MNSTVVAEPASISDIPECEGGNSTLPGKVNLNKENVEDIINKNGKILHFCDGKLEECEHAEDETDKTDEMSKATVDPGNLSWGPWLLYHAANAGSKTLNAVDYVGESLANFFGITTPKYQYEIDEYEIMCAEEEEEKKDEDLEMGGWMEGSSKTLENQSKSTFSTEVIYDGPIKLQPNTIQS